MEKEQHEPTAIAIVVAEPLKDEAAKPTHNDSSAGYARMCQDLEPYAKALRSACSILFVFSVFLFGSLEGVFGLCAACGVLCCAAPGSLGTAYAARCTRILAVMCAGVALAQITMMATVGFLMPEMAPALDEICTHENAEQTAEAFPASGAGNVVAAVPLRQHAAQHIVAFAAKGARRLSAVAPTTLADVKCDKAATFVQDVLPTAIMVGVMLEFGLFAAAMVTARHARRIMWEARRQGANAM